MIKLYFIRWYEGQFNEYEWKVTEFYGNYKRICIQMTSTVLFS